MARILHKIKIAEISGVDFPACEHCKITIMKRFEEKDISMIEETCAEILKRFETTALEYQAENPGMTFAKAFSDVYQDPKNREFVAAERQANGFCDYAPIAKALPQVESLDPEIEQNMALDKLKQMAAKFRESHPEMTPEQAFAKVYTDPGNLHLQKREREASRLRLANAQIRASVR